MRLANLVGAERTDAKLSQFIAAGNGTDPRKWNMILHQDSDELCNPAKDPVKCTATLVLDRPVVWYIS